MEREPRLRVRDEEAQQVSVLMMDDGKSISDVVRDAFDAAGFTAVEWTSESRGPLMLCGGLGGVGFGSPSSAAPADSVMQAIRQAHAADQWIAAPGVALVAALKALEVEVVAGGASSYTSSSGVTVFPDLRLMCLTRPMNETDDKAFATIAQRLAQELTRRRKDTPS